jgi:predicted DsbA family dithiol-disulfide isomerase
VKKVFGIIAAIAAVVALDVVVFRHARERFAQTEYRVYRAQDIRCRTEGFPVAGSEGAPVTMVHYAGFECKYTAKMYRVLDTIIERFGPEKVRIVHKPRPLHESRFRRLRARAAYAAHRQGAFFVMKEALTAIALSEDEAVREDKLHRDIRSAAEAAGLDMARFERDMASAEVERTIREVVAETETYGIYHYPAVFINGHLVRGVRPSAYFIERISDMLPEPRTDGAHQEEKV